MANEGDEVISEAHGAYKTAVDLVCEAVSLIGKAQGESQVISDVTLFELAKEFKLNPGGRAAQFVDHFLFGGGEAIYFPCAQMLNENTRVRKVVRDAITKRLTDNPKLATRNMSGGDFLITIRQGDYDNPDWKNALGSYALEWEIVGISGDRKRTYARVYGANEYKWHPDDTKRVSQCLHQAGDRLTRSKEVRARNFWMVAQPCTIDVDTGMPIPSPVGR